MAFFSKQNRPKKAQKIQKWPCLGKLRREGVVWAQKPTSNMQDSKNLGANALKWPELENEFKMLKTTFKIPKSRKVALGGGRLSTKTHF